MCRQASQRPETWLSPVSGRAPQSAQAVNLRRAAAASSCFALAVVGGLSVMS
jgi:hypothetical protein